MNVITATFLILTIIPATSYGWGMRGTTIGGEKGAMLPGALIGGLLALFSDILIVQEHFYIFSALGAVAMYFGGCMTYGETLSLSMSARPAINMKKGLLALLIKGALWFGSFGCIFSTGVNAITGLYGIIDILIIIIATPLSALLFYKLLNHPHSVKDNVYPKIYFSKTRQESWGAMLGIFLSLFVFSVIRGNSFSIIFPISCAIFGGIGWVSGQLMQVYCKHYAEDSEGFGRLFSVSRGVESWKAMECILGAFGGLGAAIGFILSYNSFRDTVYNLEMSSGPRPINKVLSLILLILWLLLLGGDMAHYFIKKPSEESKYMKAYSMYKKSLEPVEFVLYAALPFILICLGDGTAARTTSFFLLYWVIAQEVAFENEMPRKKSLILKIPLSIIGVIALLLSIIPNNIIDYKLTFMMYTVIYELLTLVVIIPEFMADAKKRANGTDTKKEAIKKVLKRNPTLIVHSYFVICIISTLLLVK